MCGSIGKRIQVQVWSVSHGSKWSAGRVVDSLGYKHSQIVSKQSNADKSGLWAISNFLLSDQTFITSFVSDQRFPMCNQKCSQRALIFLSFLTCNGCHFFLYLPLFEAQCTIEYLLFCQSILVSTHKAVLTTQGGPMFSNYLQQTRMRISSASILHHKEMVNIWAFRKYVWAIKADNQLCEWSEFPLWVIKDILMITHAPVLSTHRGFFCPISFMP